MTQTKAMAQQAGSVEKNRITLLKFLIIVLPMWISAKFYAGPYMEFIRNYFASIILIILFGLIVQMIYTRASEKGVLALLFVVLSAFEVVIYFMPELLSGLSFSVGQATFFGGEQSLHKIAYYGVGGFIGFFVLKQGRKS